MKRVLVTGGAGFIGSHVVQALLARGCEVMSYDCLMPQVHPASPNWPEYQPPQEGLTLHYEDVRNRPELAKTLRTFRPDTIVHLAAMVGVAQSNHQIAEYVSANVLGTTMLLDRVVEYNQEVRENQEKVRLIIAGADDVTPAEGETSEDAVKRYLDKMAPVLERLRAAPQQEVQQVLIAGSMSSYGEGSYKLTQTDLFVDPESSDDDPFIVYPPSDFVPGDLLGPDGLPVWDAPNMEPYPTKETSRLAPASVYSWSKLEQERLGLLVGKVRGLSVKVARFFNTYGPNQSLSNPYTGIGAIFSARVLAHLNPVVFEDGKQLRDFTYVTDVADAVLCILDKGLPGEVYNVGTGVPTSVLDVATAICDGTFCSPEVTHVRRTGDIRHCYADASKLRALGWEPKVPLEEGMRLLREWVATQPADATTELLDKANKDLEKYGLLTICGSAPEDAGGE